MATIFNKIFLILAIASAAMLVACDAGPRQLRLLAPSSEEDQKIAGNLASTLQASSTFRLLVGDEPIAGEDAMDMLLAGEADLALVSNYLPFRDGIFTVLPLYPSVLHIAYREGRDTSSAFALLDQATVLAGVKGSASRLMFERIAIRAGLSPEDFTFVDYSAESDAIRPDIIVVFAPISPQRASVFHGYRLFSFGTPAEIGSGSIVDAAALLNPPLRPFVIPATTYDAANAEAVVTVAVDKLLVVGPGVDASLVYDLIWEIHRSQPALSADRPGVFNELGRNFDLINSTFVLHTGTQNYLHRDEPTVYERYSGVAEVVVTLMIALISAGFAMVRIIKIRRKNRIDEFYSAAIEIRNTISTAPTAEQKRAAANKLRELQDSAFEQLVDEKLAADESFRIFITLSNDILEKASE